MTARGHTRAQRSVLAVLGGDERFVSAQDLHAQLRDRGDTVGLTSVYRALQSLTESGEVDSLRTASGELTYRSCASSSHHHHLVCQACGRTVEIEATELEAWVAEMARGHGYTVSAHLLEVTGTCATCR